jgi:hypothetical protein
MQLELLTQLGLAGALCAYIWNDAKRRNEKTEAKVEALKDTIQIIEKDVQGVKDIQGNKLDALSADFKEFKHDINDKLEALRVMVHKDKNEQVQTHAVLSLLLEYLTKDEKK